MCIRDSLILQVGIINKNKKKLKKNKKIKEEIDITDEKSYEDMDLSLIHI